MKITAGIIIKDGAHPCPDYFPVDGAGFDHDLGGNPPHIKFGATLPAELGLPNGATIVLRVSRDDWEQMGDLFNRDDDATNDGSNVNYAEHLATMIGEVPTRGVEHRKRAVNIIARCVITLTECAVPFDPTPDELAATYDSLRSEVIADADYISH